MDNGRIIGVKVARSITAVEYRSFVIDGTCIWCSSSAVILLAKQWYIIWLWNRSTQKMMCATSHRRRKPPKSITRLYNYNNFYQMSQHDMPTQYNILGIYARHTSNKLFYTIHPIDPKCASCFIVIIRLSPLNFLTYDVHAYLNAIVAYTNEPRVFSILLCRIIVL